ncbi:PaaI family thioesterase [Aspergillus puulaauensis]|uniref:Thioesterase domain-containing protein n=1 Tax=Aspergillus puulaauensis TaxID=1220207 RepID=A0A7R7XLI9_9EURO|nr:uncharacterized protein APUU_31704S [Aspergillus puulaauensis]BCS23479.1 hypothetical protein APUU_31704S [Aspergillus puulaauensis]
MESQNDGTNTAALEAETNHFMSIPWCRSHLCEPNFQPVKRPRKPSPDHGHTLFGKTWFTEDTLPHLLALYRQPQLSTAGGWRGEMRIFITIGTGLNEHPNVFHGGAIAAVLDRALGLLVSYAITDGRPAYTVVLTTAYKKTIKTPQTIMTRSWITKTEGRKVWARGQIENSTGDILATAEGILVKKSANL